MLVKLQTMSAVYLHIPFCVKRCDYCDFITYAGQGEFLDEYHQALIKEIQFYGGKSSRANSIYFGGGTPSLLSPGQVDALLRAIDHSIGIEAKAEITLEANPGTVDYQELKAFKRSGINRLSLGVQSFIDRDLRSLGRIHNTDQAISAIIQSRDAGFDNLSLDLIFGLANQSLADWESNLEGAAEMGVEHLSLYSLIVEPGTPLAKRVENGEVVLPDDDLAADMYELTMDKLPQLGLFQYEISSWAKSEALESRHNKVYWKNQDYIGIGAGAHGKYGDRRVRNVSTIPAYIKLSRSQASQEEGLSWAVEEVLPISEKEAMQETMMLGLRMTREGVSAAEFLQTYGQAMESVFDQEITKLIKLGLVEWIGTGLSRRLILTRRGIMLGNLVFQEFV
ncbi:MAG: radical SAM family heme chaperone HemW [Anaerolineaceae bacterium]|nr:radical SAM family heme chaperone HemW [Anaerolineaceae bacterium]